MRSDTSLSITAREILAYLTEHPDAQDTLDGVSQWWLPQVTVRYNRADVEKALDKLVREGMIVEIRVQGSPPLYRLSRRKRGI